MKQVIVIGAGGAGLSAALSAKEMGANVIVVTKEYPTRSQTCMAQGGINAVLQTTNDSIEKHIEDTLNSSQNLADRHRVEFMCHKAPDVIKWLDSIGVVFSRDNNHKIAQRKLGGASGIRACYAKDYTGLKILHTLYDRCIKEGVEFLNEHHLLEILLDTNNSACGVSLLDKFNANVKVLSSNSVILATGGYAKIYGKHSTNSSVSMGDGVALAKRVGAKISNMEFIQFHPTALKNSSILISESARGAGGYLLNSNGERFVNELLSRDVVSRAIYDEIQNSRDVFLDIRHLSKEFIEAELPQEAKLAMLYEDVDVTKELIPIKPVAHYCMGGIAVDSDCRSSVDGLFAAGECANHRVHGANRLGGNSLLEIIVFGRVAGANAVKNIRDTCCRVEPKKLDRYFEYENSINFYDIKDKLNELMYNKVGITRDKTELASVLEYVMSAKANLSKMGISDKTRGYNTNLVEFLEFENMLDICEMVILSALSRKESRGAHIRVDYLQSSDEFMGDTIL